MNKAQATVRMDMVQTNSMLESQLRTAAQEMLVVALRAEADAYILQAQSARDADGRQLVVGNGLSQERTVHTTIGTMHVRQPRVHDGREGFHYSSAILPPYVRRTMKPSMPWWRPYTCMEYQQHAWKKCFGASSVIGLHR